MKPSAGVHHVTATAADEDRTTRFYRDVLGLRLVKRTVSFADTRDLHLYFGDDSGRPGSIVTFFVRAAGVAPEHRQHSGGGPVFSIPPGTAERWRARLRAMTRVEPEPARLFGAATLRMHDPDGLPIVLVEQEGVPANVEAAHLFGVCLHSVDAPDTGRMLQECLGYRVAATEQHCTRLAPTDSNSWYPGRCVDIRGCDDNLPGPRLPGMLHHVAFRATDREHQDALVGRVAAAGFGVTDRFDRRYFESVYFVERGGNKMEIATEGPGFGVDEAAGSLGGRLCLPPWLECWREEIEARVQCPPVESARWGVAER